MLADILRDFRSVVTDYKTYPSEEKMPREVKSRHGILAARCVKETMALLVGYNERTFKNAYTARQVLLHLRHTRKDIIDQLESEGVSFNYHYRDGLLYARLVDESEVTVMYPMTTAAQAEALKVLIDDFEIDSCSIH